MGLAVKALDEMNAVETKLVNEKTPAQKAQKLMRKETCLKPEGKAIMVEVAADEAKANTYLSCYKVDSEDEDDMAGSRLFRIKHKLTEKFVRGMALEDVSNELF